MIAQIGADLAEGIRRSGEWVVCRRGCTQCCIGPFAITPLDALRLREGMAGLEAAHPDRAQAVRDRAAEYVRAIEAVYPGDVRTGELWDDDGFPSWTDNLPCPALDPAAGTCDLYDARPVTCRTFGPATRTGENTVAACELCYEGATDEEIAACAVDVDAEGLEARLVEELADHGVRGTTIVAFVLGRRG